MGALRIVPVELVLLLVAFWHSVYWFILRTSDNSDEPWGLISLATVLVLVVSAWNRKASFFNAGKLVPISIVLIIAYCASFVMVPPLVRCLIAVCAVGVVVWHRCLPEKRNAIALFGFLILSSPLIASLQFFIGFPLRLLVTNISAVVMQFSGTAVAVAGTSFEHHNRMILVDSPCSGINMLWAGFYFCFVLCWTKHLSPVRSTLLMIFAVTGVLLTNVSRATVLVYVDILRDRGLIISELAHDFVSVASFLTLAVSIAIFGNWLALRRCMFLRGLLRQFISSARRVFSVESTTRDFSAMDKTSARAGSALFEPAARRNSSGQPRARRGSSVETMTRAVTAPVLETQIVSDNLGGVNVSRARRAFASFAVASAVACLVPFLQTPYHEDTTKIMATEFPQQFEGHSLKPVELSYSEAKFSPGFPGRIAKFTDGKRTILFRQVNKPTRQLHPSSDCYKGNCFQLHPMAALRDAEGKIWSRFSAIRNGQKLEVREIVSDSKGRTWSDTSSWYWSALLGKTQSPWVAVTVASVSN